MCGRRSAEWQDGMGHSEMGKSELCPGRFARHSAEDVIDGPNWLTIGVYDDPLTATMGGPTMYMLLIRLFYDAPGENIPLTT